MMSGKDTHWLVIPIGQQINGAWVDEIMRDRMREAPLPGRYASEERLPPSRVEVARGTDVDAAITERYYRRGWTDGLPILAPTLPRVQAMLAAAGIAPHTEFGEMEPMRGIAKAEKLAANAVMAGCAPEHFPVVLAAVKGLLDPKFNLNGVQTTDENVAPLVVVSGPIADRIGLNAGIGALGPGWHANAAIGRAIRLIMMNVGGGWLGVVSLAGIGQPARYTLCLAEQERPPWPLLHVEAGLATAQSAVTLMRAEGVITVTGELDDIASVMGSAVSVFSIMRSGRVAVLIAPAVAATLVEKGWSKADVARYLWEQGRLPVDEWRRTWIFRQIAGTVGVPEWAKQHEASGAIPVVEAPEHIAVFVAGGDAPIPQNVYFPSWGFPACRLTLPIEVAVAA